MAELDGLDRRRIGEVVLDVVRPHLRVYYDDGPKAHVDREPSMLAEEIVDELERYGFKVRRG